MNEFLRYLRFGFGVRRSFFLTYGHTIWAALLIFLWHMLVAGVVIVAILGLLQWHDDDVESAVSENKEYIRELEKVTARCTERGDHSIIIGNELWYCGAHPTGIKTL